MTFFWSSVCKLYNCSDTRQPTVADPAAGWGGATWNLYGRLRQPSFYDLFLQGQAGMAPSVPLGSATGQTLKFVSYIELKLRKSNKKTQAMKV